MKNSKKAALVFRLVWGISPAYFFLLLFNSLSYSGQILANVVFPKYLIDELMGGQNPTSLVFWVAIIAASNLLFAFLTKTAKRLLDVREKRFSGRSSAPLRRRSCPSNTAISKIRIFWI